MEQYHPYLATSYPDTVPLKPDVDASLVVGACPVDENQSSKELSKSDETGSDEENEEDILVDKGPNTTTGGEGTFHKQFAESIKMLHEFCNGLEYQIQFEDWWMLEAIEWDGLSLFYLV